jgi:hypothetical protein
MTDEELDYEAMELACRPIMDRIVKALDRLGWKIVSQNSPEAERPWSMNGDHDDCPAWAVNAHSTFYANCLWSFVPSPSVPSPPAKRPAPVLAFRRTDERPDLGFPY